MLWVKALHIVFVVSWFAGLFYLPRLYVYHAQAEDTISRERFKVMERRLYRGIMTPAMVLTLVTGVWMWLGYGVSGGWLYAKLLVVALLIAFHEYLGVQLRAFAGDENRHSHKFYRWVNEVPLVLLAAIVVLVVVKPF
jgi:putative membrane protein